jgi:threonine dehydrogenase-like Zn-dependent dehydrogenase
MAACATAFFCRRSSCTILASRNSAPAEHHRVLDLMESGRIDVTASPTELAKPAAMGERFPAWLHRETGIVKAVIEWS